MERRYSGILLSVTSLPSKYGIGCFDKAAYDFVDWLEDAGQNYWQILPLGATSHGGSDDSPYQAYSAFAGNPYMISLDALIKEGVLTQAEVDAVDFGTDPACVDFDKLHENRFKLLRKAYERSDISRNPEFQKFCNENHWWLNDYALFMAVKEYLGDKPFSQWPEDIRMHWGFALDYYNTVLYFDVEFHKYMQFKFTQQWTALKTYANAKNIKIVGDIPIYVSPDSADVWANPELFQLDENNKPTKVAGCPPDAFAKDGQIWGNPLYRWDYHKQTGFQWWITRMWYSTKLYDVVRIDHFRGFDQYYAIPTTAKRAVKEEGCDWEQGPGMDLFNAIQNALGKEGVIAEDLGTMTDSVRQLVKDSGYPNMKVIQFAFDLIDIGAANDYWPHNYGTNHVVYSGTHDNETLQGWFDGMNGAGQKQVRDYLCDYGTPDQLMHKPLVAEAMRSTARICIIPIQDHLGLGNEARMNAPGTVGKNWRWRLVPGQVTEELAGELEAQAKRYGRANWVAVKAKLAKLQAKRNAK